MSQTSHSSVSGASSGGGTTTNSTCTTQTEVADTNVAQLLIEAVSILRKIEYHLSLSTDADLSNTEL